MSNALTEWTTQAMNELDDAANVPEGLDAEVWRRLCEVRRKKVDNEQLIKEQAHVLSEMKAFLQKRAEEDERMRAEGHDLEAAIDKY